MHSQRASRKTLERKEIYIAGQHGDWNCEHGIDLCLILVVHRAEVKTWHIGGSPASVIGDLLKAGTK